MTNDIRQEFRKLEMLNSQIDVWIDDEDYTKVDGALNCDDGDGKIRIDELFGKHSNTHEAEFDSNWQNALDNDDCFPVKTITNNEYSLNFDFEDYKDKHPLVKYWSYLFYVKLLRAKILKKGSIDCYTRRLDDVAVYLNRHMPKLRGKQDEWFDKLTIIYLLELSAVSQDSESLGLAERARRIIGDSRYLLKPEENAKDKDKTAAYEFYKLLSRYDCGVAYFHQGYYRKSVLEFNQIIWQVNKWIKDNQSNGDSKSSETWRFFKTHSGNNLLYVPAILHRAEVQLKLQFAYHTLDTLNKYLWKNPNLSQEDLSPHKKIQAMLLEAQAFQQMGRLDKSWEIFTEGKEKKGQDGICKCITGDFQLGQRKEGKFPELHNLNKYFPGLGERFLDILIADHLDWLKLEGEDPKQKSPELAALVMNGKAGVKDYLDSVNKSQDYLNRLEKAFSLYFGIVKSHAYNRHGYFQQLAKYFEWLARAADVEFSDQNTSTQQKTECGNARDTISEIAKGLYRSNRNHLLDKDNNGDKKVCNYCDPKGIDLRRLDPEHYKWFTDDMLAFFNSTKISESKNMNDDKKEFIKRLERLEWSQRDDRRISDLVLRQEFSGSDEIKLHGEEICWNGIQKKDRASFADFLNCARANPKISKCSSPLNCLAPDDYSKIMKDWEDQFTHHLHSPSAHQYPYQGFYFSGLQRWNSASPAKGFSVGGGYLLYYYNKDNKCVDMGVAIDPGFDFVRNLFHMGFSLDDIDIVLISHAHLDHIRDFESIIMLLSELKKRKQREKRVHVILSLGAYKRLEHIIEDPGFRYFIEPYIIDVDREIDDNYFESSMSPISFKPIDKHRGGKSANKKIERIKVVLPWEEPRLSKFLVKITPMPAYHDDKTHSDSFGFVVELRMQVKLQKEKYSYPTIRFGYTGDTKWVNSNMEDPLAKEEGVNRRERHIIDLAKQYLHCDVLLAHLGSLITKGDDDSFLFSQYDQCDPKNNKNKYKCEKLVRDKDHPYLIGMLRLLSSIYKDLSETEHERKSKPLVLISEFGEELKGHIRSDFVQRLNNLYKNELAFLPVDVGITVHLHSKNNIHDHYNDNRCTCTVWCIQCDNFISVDDADFELYGTDHALFCVCRTCRKNVPRDVLERNKRQLYEVGLELKADDST